MLYQPCHPLGKGGTKITACPEHVALSHEAACEGIVLLKNENSLLPFRRGERIALFGKAQIDYVMCGGGAGWVHTAYERNLYEGLKHRGDIEVFEPLSQFYKSEVEKIFAEEEIGRGRMTEILPPPNLVDEAREFTDVAIISLCRYSAEGEDRYGDGSDPYFELSAEERELVKTVRDSFEKIVVVLNTGAMIDTSWLAYDDKIGAALMIWQGGMEGGLAAADVLSGRVCPSGKLVDTCARDFMDYPSSEGFHESPDYVKYTEDIFVGYRYFETIPKMAERVVYPFGFGLSYTEFSLSDISAVSDGEKITVSAAVKNIGDVSGKEVVQVYYRAPDGKITKAARCLAAFKKTALLAPGESERVRMSFAIDDMASYDDVGDVHKSAYVMEAGEYKIFVGTDVRSATEIEYKHVEESVRIVEELTEYCAPTRLGKRLLASGEYATVPDCEREEKKFPCDYACEENIPACYDDSHMLIEVAEGKITLDEFITQLTNEEMLAILIGQKNLGVANTCGLGGGLRKFEIPTPMTADGPAGLRIFPRTGISTTAFPIETMLACTWNPELLARIGVAVALEAKENNLSIWLAPALNIHRSPLCGRNFEYFSEDPLISGKMAAAMVRGVQSQGIVATPKHLACNNKETNRLESDSIVSERALREIYLKGFEICVKESAPKLIMSSYNRINGVRASECAELITGILRGEWGFKGVVTSDWWNNAEKSKEVTAGNDIHMPYSTDIRNLSDYIDTISVENTRSELAVCVKRLLELILWLE